MKIVHVITAFGLGGAEKLLLDIVNRQVINHTVHLIHLKKIDDLAPNLNEKVIIKHIEFSFLTYNNLRAYFKMIYPDIIHTHCGHADIFGIWSSRKLSAKVFCTMHNVSIQKDWTDAIYFELYKFLFSKISKNITVISISKSVEKHVIKKLKIPKNRSHLLYNAIALPDRNKKIKKSSTKLKLLFVGRLVKQKSVDTLLKAIHVVKEMGLGTQIELKIVGDGGLRKSLELLSENLSITDIVGFEGSHTDVINYYNTAHIFILPSIWEGFGIVILEAFRSRNAVIASNIEGPAELIVNNQNGLLFEPNDHYDLANKIISLIQDNELRNKLADEGYCSFLDKYNIEEYVNKLNLLYENS